MSDATSTIDATTDNVPVQSPVYLPSKKYSCTSCGITFQSGQEQRLHMKEAWHIDNMRRRVASPLSTPITSDAFDAQFEGKQAHVRRVSPRQLGDSSIPSDQEISDQEEDENASPFRCLFCDTDFECDDAGLGANLEHMHASHGMLVPNSDRIVDMQSFLGYLATEVRTWHECLYCGATKPTTKGVQSHMKDKGHCILNLDREPELLEFWEIQTPIDGEDPDATPPQIERPKQLSATEMRLASGKEISSRRSAPTSARTHGKLDLAATVSAPSGDALVPRPRTTSSDQTPDIDERPRTLPGQQLVRRQEMGIVGVSAQGRRALVLAEKKAQRSEAAARRAREWVNAKTANLQEFDQVDTKMKIGKQNHKLQPR